MQHKRLLLAATAFLGIVPIGAQPTRPASIVFDCPSHDTDTGHEVDIIRESDGVLVRTIQGGDPPANAAGEVTIPLDPTLAPGRYRILVRVITNSAQSDDVAVIWEKP